MRRFSVILTVLLTMFVTQVAAQQARYIFYFIGDGMGVNQVNGTEAMGAELQGRIGTEPLLFTQFPYCGLVTTYSATNGVTDSAAGGTALATGYKTKNGTLGMLKDQKTVIYSIAVKAKEAGMRVGIGTSVSVDHATPASFYAHTPSRSNYYDIGKDLIKAGFDFYAGSDFQKPVSKKAAAEGSLYEQCEAAGYTIARGYADYQKKNDKAQRLILLQTEEASKRDRYSIPYAIDREKGDMTLQEITNAAIDFLSEDSDKGFFMMIEGGKIDWACHANDAGTVFREVEDLDNAVELAYDFYKKHPQETLIVITADHETGGIGLGTGEYAQTLKALGEQKMSVNKLSNKMNELRRQTGNKVTWEMAKDLISDSFGLWSRVSLTEKQEARLKETFDKTFLNQQPALDESEYQKDEPLATVAKEVINEIAMVGWMSGSHSNGYVPVFAIGAGAERFCHKMDNTDIPKKICEAAGWAK